jgi:hypothetical protein
MSLRVDQFTAHLESLPARDTATALILLACRKQDENMLAGTMVYFSRQFGTQYWADLLVDEIEPLLNAEECAWMWQTVNTGGDRP